MTNNNILFGLLLLVSLVCVFQTIKLHNTQTKLSEVEDNFQFLSDHPVIKTDTFYTKDPKDIIPPTFKNIVTPHKINIHPGNPANAQPITKQEEILTQKGSCYNEPELTPYPPPYLGSNLSPSSGPALLGFLLNKNQLKISFANDSITYSQEYHILPLEYKYSFYQGKLTAEKLTSTRSWKFQPYVEGTYRPINRLFDLNAGVELRTKHLDYSIHLNTFYYPKFETKGFDVCLGLRYNF